MKEERKRTIRRTVSFCAAVTMLATSFAGMPVGTYQDLLGFNLSASAVASTVDLTGLVTATVAGGLSHVGTITGGAGGTITITPAAGYKFSGTNVTANVTGDGTVGGNPGTAVLFPTDSVVVNVNGEIVITLNDTVTAVTAVTGIDTVTGVTENSDYALKLTNNASNIDATLYSDAAMETPIVTENGVFKPYAVGATVYVKLTPTTGYEITTTLNDPTHHDFFNYNGSPVTVTKQSDGTYTGSFTTEAGNSGSYGAEITNVWQAEPINYALTAPTLTDATVAFKKANVVTTTANYGDTVTMTITPAVGHSLPALTVDSFTVTGGTKGTYENGVLTITDVTGAVTVEATGAAAVEEYNGVNLPVTGIVEAMDQNITVDANAVTWANKSTTEVDDTVSYGDTVIIPVYATGYTISGTTPTISINNGAFQITGAYSSTTGNVTFTMPDIGDNNAIITAVLIDGLTTSTKSYDIAYNKSAMKIYSNVLEPVDGAVTLTGLPVDTDGTLAMKGSTGYYAELIYPTTGTYVPTAKLFGINDPDGNWGFIVDQPTITEIKDANGKIVGFYFVATPEEMENTISGNSIDIRFNAVKSVSVKSSFDYGDGSIQLTAIADTAAGSTVTIPAANMADVAGYKFSGYAVTYVDAKGVTQKVTVTYTEGVYTFTMPDAAVTVTSNYTKKFVAAVATTTTVTPDNTATTDVNEKKTFADYVILSENKSALCIGDSFAISVDATALLTAYSAANGGKAYEISSVTINGQKVSVTEGTGNNVGKYIAVVTITKEILGTKTGFTVDLALAQAYAITAPENCSVASNVVKGQTVTFKPTVDSGNVITKVTYVKTGSTTTTPTTITADANGYYSFVMPAYDVTIAVATQQMYTVVLPEIANAIVTFGGKDVTGQNSIVVAKGSSAKLIIKPATGYSITDAAASAINTDATGVLAIGQTDITKDCVYSSQTITYTIDGGVTENITFDTGITDIIEQKNMAVSVDTAANGYTITNGTTTVGDVKFTGAIPVKAVTITDVTGTEYTSGSNVSVGIDLGTVVVATNEVCRVAVLISYEQNPFSAYVQKLSGSYQYNAGTMVSEWVSAVYNNGSLTLEIPEDAVNTYTIDSVVAQVAKEAAITTQRTVTIPNNMLDTLKLVTGNSVAAISESNPVVVGDTVRLAVAPANGYKLTQVGTVTFDGVDYKLTLNSDGTAYADILITEDNYTETTFVCKNTAVKQLATVTVAPTDGTFTVDVLNQGDIFVGDILQVKVKTVGNYKFTDVPNIHNTGVYNTRTYVADGDYYLFTFTAVKTDIQPINNIGAYVVTTADSATSMTNVALTASYTYVPLAAEAAPTVVPVSFSSNSEGVYSVTASYGYVVSTDDGQTWATQINNVNAGGGNVAVKYKKATYKVNVGVGETTVDLWTSATAKADVTTVDTTVASIQSISVLKFNVPTGKKLTALTINGTDVTTLIANNQFDLYNWVKENDIANDTALTIEPTYEAIDYAITANTGKFEITGLAEDLLANYSDSVNFTVTADEGYNITNIVIKDANGNKISYTSSAGNTTVEDVPLFGDVQIPTIADGATYTFAMPASAVSIEVTAVQEGATVVRTPEIKEAPTASIVKTGSTLASSTLTGGKCTYLDSISVAGTWSWAKSDEVLTQSGYYKAVFTPSNSIYSSTSVLVKVTVAKSTMSGDVTGDGKVTVADVISINKYMAGMTTLEDWALLNGDMNKDGKVNNIDGLKIMKILGGLA